MFVGVTEIIMAGLSIASMVLATVILIIMINASQLILIGVYLTMSNRIDTLFHSIEVWLNQNNRWIAGVISLIGVFLLWEGISGLEFFG
jgi:hypothetical protein